MSTLLYVCYWFLHLAVLSSILAVYEILMEKGNGWASALNPNTWGRKIGEGTYFAQLIEKPYLTVYHIVMFGAIIPALLACELFAFQSIAHPVVTRNVLAVWHVGSITFMPLLSAIATWHGLCVLEDFLWFVLNWHYPTSLSDLLSGKIWWHTKWANVGRIKFPRYYISSAAQAAVFLALSAYLAH